jgi:histidine triad (HIT) family protein
VVHLHFHIIPRFEAEPLKGHGQAPKADAAALQAQAKAISAAIT